MYRPKPLEDEVKAAKDFAGLVNAKSSKDIGYKGLTIANNVEITDTKKVTRRFGYTLATAGAYTALYGTDAQDRMYVVKGGSLMDRARATGAETVLQTGLVGTNFSWDEDPNNNVYYTSDRGDNGIITNRGVWLPLSLAVPVVQGASAVDPGTWAVVPFHLGKRYSDSPRVRMQVAATYVYPDGRESAISDPIQIPITPEVRLIQLTIPVGPTGCTTRIYATSPGGSSYFLIGTTTKAICTLSVADMNWTRTGVEYQHPVSVISFPTDAKLLGFFKGQLMAATYDPQADQGALYFSLPLHYHLFDPQRSGGFLGLSSCPLLILPYGQEHKMSLEETADLIIGTSTNIYHYNGEKLTEVADYGVIPGVCGDVSKEGVPYFWTVRGVAKAMPYELVTQDTFYGDPGVFNHSKIIYDRGYGKLVSSTVSGNPVFNQWSER